MTFPYMLKSLLIGLIGICFLVMLPLSFAQEALPLAPASSVPHATPIEYALPYPGILPDHPLYFLKNLRDRILLLLITNPLRKVEFYILLSDKHLNMSIELMNKNKTDLGLKTAAQSIVYLQQAEKLIFEIPAGGNAQVAEAKERFEKSLTKHKMEITNFSVFLPQEQKTQVAKLESEIDLLLQDFLRKK